MSHFSLIVVSDQKPTQESLAPVLQPWHEYECTGVRDQYVVEEDVTDEVVEEFGQPVKVVVLADGEVADRYDESFYVTGPDPSFPSLTKKSFVLPEGAKEAEMPADEARKHSIGYATIEECAKEYFGINEESCRDGKFYRLTNPSKKWDWWQIGGRWTGMLAISYDPSEDPENKERCFLCGGTGKREDMECVSGCNGCKGTGISIKWPTQWRAVGSVARRGDVPIEAIRDVAEFKALQEYDKFHAVVAGRDFPTWEDACEQHTAPGASHPDYKAVREAFNTHPVVQELKAAAGDEYFFGLTELVANLKLPREERAKQARDAAVCPFAFVRDGKWFERGSMGWWGTVSDEKDRASWARDFAKMLDEMPADKWLAVVDCHI